MFFGSPLVIFFCENKGLPIGFLTARVSCFLSFSPASYVPPPTNHALYRTLHKAAQMFSGNSNVAMKSCFTLSSSFLSCICCCPALTFIYPFHKFSGAWNPKGRCSLKFLRESAAQCSPLELLTLKALSAHPWEQG